jgi:glycosyltransferase involved in cell wall biosynthesis
MKYFFSIITPTYNRAHMLPKTIESVINQTFSDWELIIVDDGSTDHTKSLVEKYCATDSRIKYIYQENVERSVARNNGIDNAEGEYICFLDSDDQYDVNFLEAIYQKLIIKPFDLVITSQEIISNKMKSNLITPKKSVFDINYFFKSSIVPGRVCVKSSFLGGIRFKPHIRISEDTYFLCELAIKKPEIVLVEGAKLIYHEHPDNSVNFKKNNAYLERINTLKEISKSYLSKGLKKEVVKKVINDSYFGVFKYYYFNNDFFNARLSILKSLLYLPTYRFKEKIYLLLFAHKENLFLNDG